MDSSSFQEKIRKCIQRRGCEIKNQPKPVLNVAEATRILSSYRQYSKITGRIFFLGYNILLPSVVFTHRTPTSKLTFFLHLFAPLWWIILVKIPTPNLYSANFFIWVSYHWPQSLKTVTFVHIFAPKSLSTQLMVIQEIRRISTKVRKVASAYISLLSRIILAKPEEVWWKMPLIYCHARTKY